MAICGTCEVQAQCRSYAMKNGEEYGVWAKKNMRKSDNRKG